jgi:hypothetical protein
MAPTMGEAAAYEEQGSGECYSETNSLTFLQHVA